MEYEVGGLDYRYVYGNGRLSVDIKGVTTSSGNIIENGDHIRLYYHMDYLGTVDYLTSPVSKKIVSWTHYNEWGEITHNVVLKCGQREIDLVKRYATHDYDSVLGLYYAKARLYDAEMRRFTAMDPILDASGFDIKDYAKDPMQLVQYLYVKNNPLVYIDPTGLFFNDVRDWLRNKWNSAKAWIEEKFNEAVNKVTSTLENVTKHFTDPVRLNDVKLGVAAAIVKDLLDSGAVPLAVALDFVNNLVSNIMGSKYTTTYYDRYIKNSEALVELLASKLTYPDSFYFGKILGDVVLAGAGIGASIIGIKTIIGSITLGAGAAASSGGLALFASIAIAVEGVKIGSLTAAAGFALSAAGIGNLGGDIDNYKYFSKLDCEGGSKSEVAINNDILGKPRVGSALKLDKYHAFPDIVDNYAELATKTPINNGTLYQLEGSLNGVQGRFEWIIDSTGQYAGQVTHRYFVPGGTLNGVPIKP